MKPIIAIPMGDAAGIGPEITVRALADKMIQDIARCVVVGDKDVLEDAIRVSGVDLKIKCIEEPANGDYTPGVLNLIDLDNIDMNTLKIGEIQAMTGQAAYEYIKKATELCLERKADVLTTTAINKESLK
ncbi:MAG: 4-hydroxythreonine-4-phosphate dehydrogenase PdxA, partial [Eubacterium callanderi]